MCNENVIDVPTRFPLTVAIVPSILAGGPLAAVADVLLPAGPRVYPVPTPAAPQPQAAAVGGLPNCFSLIAETIQYNNMYENIYFK